MHHAAQCIQSPGHKICGFKSEGRPTKILGLMPEWRLYNFDHFPHYTSRHERDELFLQNLWRNAEGRIDLGCRGSRPLQFRSEDAELPLHVEEQKTVPMSFLKMASAIWKMRCADGVSHASNGNLGASNSEMFKPPEHARGQAVVIHPCRHSGGGSANRAGHPEE
jgi:hypothetical protein